MIIHFLSEVDAVFSKIKKLRTKNINLKSSKTQIIDLAKEYFSNIRPKLIDSSFDSDKIIKHDEHWQQLVRLAHGNNSRASYQKLFQSIRKELGEFSIIAVSTGDNYLEPNGEKASASDDERLILQTLDHLVPSAAASYRQGLVDLSEEGRISYRGTAAEFRESLRETLDHLAPDKEVEAQENYKAEPNQTRPTMKQKARFILVSRGRNKTQRQAAEKMFGLIDELSGEVLRAIYNRASLATHVHQSKGEVQQIKRYVDTMLFDILEINT